MTDIRFEEPKESPRWKAWLPVRSSEMAPYMGRVVTLLSSPQVLFRPEALLIIPLKQSTQAYLHNIRVAGLSFTLSPGRIPVEAFAPSSEAIEGVTGKPAAEANPLYQMQLPACSHVDCLEIDIEGPIVGAVWWGTAGGAEYEHNTGPVIPGGTDDDAPQTA